jgi:hypothetical protein
MWTVDVRTLVNRTRSPGGDQFAGFLDSLIAANAISSGIPYSSLHTNQKTNIGDGGVDTKVTKGSNQDQTGWMIDPTIWQYKATDADGIGATYLRNELNKPYALDCIQKGYAYRFCICDSITSEKKKEWEEVLTDACRAVNSSCPEAKVVTADDLVTWVHHYPALILRYFYPPAADVGLHLSAWRANLLTSTGIYVPVPEWTNTMDAVKAHADFQYQPPDAVLPIQGEAGVGKTRLVLEALSSLGGADGFVVYTDDEHRALALAHTLGNNPLMRCVLVADECRVQTRVRLSGLLKGHRDRVRVVTIDNSGERPAGHAPEYWLQKMPDAVLHTVLERNFPHIPEARRQTYAGLSGGFVRLASDMCNNDHLITKAGHVGPVTIPVRDYLRARLSDLEREVLEALSLVTRIGFKEDLKDELELLATLVGVEPEALKRVANGLHDSPGFVARAGRYFYVTPELVAQVAFDGAWRRWGEVDPQGFLDRIPERLLGLFSGRVAMSAPEEVRSLIGAFFRRWAHQRSPRDLANLETVDRFVTLVETQPATYWPVLRRLVEQASLEELKSVTGKAPQGWGPRRHLVWLSERMVSFPEHFADAERVLLRLALAESEPDIGNNATNIWMQIFRIYLSGSSLPFSTRHDILKKRLADSDHVVRQLALKALDGVFDHYGTRMVGSPMVGGRIRPDEWKPESRDEWVSCVKEALQTLAHLTCNTDRSVQSTALSVAVDHLRFLLSLGLLSELQVVLPSQRVPEGFRPRLEQALSEFLHYDCRADAPDRPSSTYVAAVKEWLESLQPTDFRGRLVSIVGPDPWTHSMVDREQIWRNDVRALAADLLTNPEVLHSQLDWLHSPEARASEFLGHELGKRDTDGRWVQLLMDAALRHRSGTLVRGYVRGLLQTSPSLSTQVNCFIDSVEEVNPSLAYDIFTAVGDQTNSLTRTLRLVDAQQLEVNHLLIFGLGVGDRELTEAEFCQVLSRLVQAAKSGVSGAGSGALKIVSQRLHSEGQRMGTSIFESDTVTELVWELIETPPIGTSTDSYWWGRIVTALANRDASRAARAAAQKLLDRGLHIQEKATEILLEIGQKAPDIVVRHIGEAVLDSERGWTFWVGKYKALFEGLSPDSVIRWLQEVGVEGARRIARHLPPPRLIGDELNVHPLTEYVLSHFEQDDRVFREFVAGVHSLEMYSGDIVGQHEREAEVARKFMDHPLRRIREWAVIEEEQALQQAAEWRQREEELGIE